MTPRWREMDSNPRSRFTSSPFRTLSFRLRDGPVRQVRVDSSLEGTRFEPWVPPERGAYLFPGRNTLPEPPRGGGGLSAPTGKRQCVQQRQQWHRAGTAHFAGQPFGGCACPPSGRVSRWPQPALFAQYSQVRQVSTE
jgi:hypothetical protein